MKKILLILIAVMALWSCQKEEVSGNFLTVDETIKCQTAEVLLIESNKERYWLLLRNLCSDNVIKIQTLPYIHNGIHYLDAKHELRFITYDEELYGNGTGMYKYYLKDDKGNLVNEYRYGVF